MLFVLLLSTGILIYSNSTRDDPYGRFYYLYLSAVGIISCTSLAQYLARKNILSFVKTLGVYSLQIYLVHMIAGAGTRLILANFLHIQNWIVLIIISTLVALISPILLQNISEKAGFPYFFELPKRREPTPTEQIQQT
jgi:peptidoglycan/LPS O-acetylase OafA/YrhL